MSMWDDPVTKRDFANFIEEKFEVLEAEVATLKEELADSKYDSSFVNITTLMALPPHKRVELAKKLLVGTSDEGRIK